MGQKLLQAVMVTSVKKSEMAFVMINVLNVKPTCEILCQWTDASPLLWTHVFQNGQASVKYFPRNYHKNTWKLLILSVNRFCHEYIRLINSNRYTIKAL